MQKLIGLAALSVLAVGSATGAATVIVTSPGVYTNGGGPEYSDTPAIGAWLRNSVRAGSSVGVSADFPNASTGSALLRGTDGVSKADFEYYLDNPLPLADLGTLGYEWYRSSASTAPAHFHPSMRMLYDADGDLGTTNDRGYLVFERAYNGGGVSPVPTNQWIPESIGQDTNLWMTKFGSPLLEIYNRDLNDWLTSPNPNGSYPSLNNGAVVLGLSMGIGSGWAGSYDGAVDLVSFGATGGEVTTWNFEVPAPGATCVFGLAGLTAMRRRRA